MNTYEHIHNELGRIHGPARDHLCSCGVPARDWAYQFTAGDQELRDHRGLGPHSLNLDDYAAMCQSCHRAFDMEHDSELAEAVRMAGARGNAAYAERMRTDPEFREEMREVCRRARQASEGHTLGGVATAERFKTDSEFAEKTRETLRRGNATFAERMRTDPEFREKMQDANRKGSRQRRRCSCGFISNPSGVGSHQRHTGHQGWAPEAQDQPQVAEQWLPTRQ